MSQSTRSETKQNEKTSIMVYTIAIGLLSATIISCMIMFKSSPVCQHLQIASSNSNDQKIDSIQAMNKIRANVVMEYKIPIIYIWIGKQIPPRYKQRMDWIPFEHKVIGQKQWDELATQFHEFNLQPVHKADILRLLYLKKYAGVYSDFDNVINYTCLMRMLARKTGFWMAGEPFVSWKPFASNLLLYVDRPNDLFIDTALRAIKQKIISLSNEQIQSIYSVYEVTGPGMLGRLGVQKLNEVYKCQDHERDSLWAV